MLSKASIYRGYKGLSDWWSRPGLNRSLKTDRSSVYMFR